MPKTIDYDGLIVAVGAHTVELVLAFLASNGLTIEEARAANREALQKQKEYIESVLAETEG